MSVIKVVRPETGFAQIPNSFAEDPRLSEAAIAVGLFLATRWDGYKIRPVEIQAKFSERPGKPRGREWWARVANELKSANYMWLNRIHGENGKFASDWIFCILGLPNEFPRGGSADVGSASIGSAHVGSTASRTDSKYLQEGVTQQKTTTTTTSTWLQSSIPLSTAARYPTPPQARGSGGDSGEKRTINLERLFVESSLSDLAPALLQIIQKSGVLDLQLSQDLFDELAGAIEAARRGERKQIARPQEWFRRLLAESREGKFDRTYCKVVQRRRAALTTAQSITSPPSTPKISQEAAREFLSQARAVLGNNHNR